LSNARLRTYDFSKSISQAKSGDLIFADPPYAVNQPKNGFLSYNEKVFSWDDQRRLASALEKASARGAAFILTNANHTSIDELYKFADKKLISRASLISGDPKFRKPMTEAIYSKNVRISIS
tara:strand:- start:313 stop:678 length:366 start_codon:yes stop_codon:yes gene_type:complete